MTRTPRPTATAGAALAATTAMLLAGCSTTTETAASETPSPSASPTPSVTVDPEIQEVNEAVLGAIEYVDTLHADPNNVDSLALTDYATGEYYSSAIEVAASLATPHEHFRLDRTDEIVKTEQHKSGDWNVWVCETRANARIENDQGETVAEKDEEDGLMPQAELVFTVVFLDGSGYLVASAALSDEGLCQW